MKHQDTADVVIIGAGAAGAAFAWRLSGMGLNIVCLEQGYWVKSEASPSQDENWELALQRRLVTILSIPSIQILNLPTTMRLVAVPFDGAHISPGYTLPIFK
jgi:choline dehydrogenase-like flavoprotein